MMKNIQTDRRTIVSVAAGAVLIVVIALLVGRCGRGEKKQETGPAQVVEQFCMAMASGDFSKAEELCFMDSMREYTETCSVVFDEHSKNNVKATAIAAEMLSDMTISISDVAKEGDRRLVFYSISYEGQTKEKIATLVKEEGEWKVAAITERN